MTLKEFMIVAHRKPIVIRELKKVGPTTRIRVFTNLYRTVIIEDKGVRSVVYSGKSFHTFGIRKDGSLVLNTAFGPAVKKLKGCW